MNEDLGVNVPATMHFIDKRDKRVFSSFSLFLETERISVQNYVLHFITDNIFQKYHHVIICPTFTFRFCHQSILDLNMISYAALSDDRTSFIKEDKTERADRDEAFVVGSEGIDSGGSENQW